MEYSILQNSIVVVLEHFANVEETQVEISTVTNFVKESFLVVPGRVEETGSKLQSASQRVELMAFGK